MSGHHLTDGLGTRTQLTRMQEQVKIYQSLNTSLYVATEAFYYHDFKTKATRLSLKHFPRWSSHPPVKEMKYFFNLRQSNLKSASSNVLLKKTPLCRIGESSKTRREEAAART